MATPGLTTKQAYVATSDVAPTISMIGGQNNVGDFVPAYTLVDQNGAALNPAQEGTDATGITPPTGAVGIRGWLSGIYGKLAGSIAVTGTFWQATQPVSAASLPLPTGAAQETGGNLAAILTKLGAVVLAAGGNVIGAVTQSGAWVLSAGSALIGKVGIDQTTPGTTNKVTLGTDVVTTADQNGAAFSSAIALTAGGAADAVGRSVEMLVTVGGNVSLQLASGAAHIISVSASPYTQTFPYAITAINSSGTTATATYANLH